MRRETRVARLTLVRALDGPALHYATDDLPAGRRRCRTTFIAREHAPGFDGEEGWFEMERVPAKPWAYWRAVRQVEAPR